jgi:hypothetical protein
MFLLTLQDVFFLIVHVNFCSLFLFFFLIFM